MATELPSSSGDNLQDKELSKEGIIDILGEDDDKKTPDTEEEGEDTDTGKEGEDEEDEDKKEEIELKDDEEKPEEEEEDKLVTPFKKEGITQEVSHHIKRISIS
jgi:hypothetical protein